ncbi:MAG: MOSC domain-containing protein [Halohasta sp.]
MGTVEGLFVTPESGESMVPRESVDAIEGGLVGDRYLRGTGYYSPYDVCEVTLIEAEAIETISEEFGIDLHDGRHRRNIVTRGHELHELLETTFRIGTAELRGTRPRPPCAHVEDVAEEEGVASALGEGRGGICARVESSGTIAVGDTIEVLEADPRTVGAAIADRLATDVDETAER